MVERECPRCETVIEIPADAPRVAFCPLCDAPLLREGKATALSAAGEVEHGIDHRRRMPGTLGRTALASASCWYCGERNPDDRPTCWRCGHDLSGPPPLSAPEREPEPTSPPEPPPPPEPTAALPPTPWLPWAITAILLTFVVTVTLIAWLA